MKNIVIAYSGATDVGRIRSNNEDTFIACDLPGEGRMLLAAIDGMGGEEGGEVASSLARDVIVDRLCNSALDGSTPDITLIKQAVAEANNAIMEGQIANPALGRMGCVVTAAIINTQQQTLSMAHVGDSRLYRFSEGMLQKLSHDHSFVGELEESGALTEEQAMRHPQRSVINRCLGYEKHQADDAEFIEGAIFPLESRASFLFCSDGVSDMLTSDSIAEVLSLNISPRLKCEELIERANNAGGKDNITAVVANVSGEPDTDDLEKKRQEEALFGPTEDNVAEVDAKPKRKYRRLIITTICVMIAALIFALGFFCGRMMAQDEVSDSLTSETSANR